MCIVIRFYMRIIFTQFMFDKILQENSCYWENLGKKNNFTFLAVINIFHGVNVPIPCNNNTINIKFNLSRGGLISIFARSIVIPFIELNFYFFFIKRKIFNWHIPLKLSSSFGKFVASQAGVRRTGFCKNGAFSTSVPAKKKSKTIS